MQPREPQAARSPAAASPLRPELERTLVASGWTHEELRSAQRSPLANLQVADLDANLDAGLEASFITRRPSSGSLHEPPRLPPRGTNAVWQASRSTMGDPNDTQAASDWSWMDAFAAISWADPQSTIITPSRRRDTARPSSQEMEATRVVPWTLRAASEASGAQVAEPATPAEPEAPAPPSPELSPLPLVPERPALMPGVQLLGTMPDTGFAEQQWLAQRGETFVQLSELLYRVLEQVDGRRDLEEIAALARETTGRPVSANNVRLLIAARLLPLGLVVPVGGIQADKQSVGLTARSPLAVTLRLGFMRPEWVEVVARVLQIFLWPPVLIPVMLLVMVSQVWLYLVHGVATPFKSVLQQPLLLTGIESFILLSSVFHEFGHASALRYGGGRARGIGFGIYFMYPAFYTDCTDSYRLGRWARLRTDLGGVYFDLITTLALVVLYAFTRQELLLAAVLLLDVEIFAQFNPVARFDGYWALADLIGVPDFFTLMGPTLRGLVPTLLRRRSPAEPNGPTPGSHIPALKGWVKVAFLAYTVVATPCLVVFLSLLLANAPRLFGTTVDSLAAQLLSAIAAAHADTRIELLISGVQAAILLVTVLLLLYGIGNIVRGLVRAVWRWGQMTRQRRALSALGLAGGLALLAVVWQPQLAVLIPHVAQVTSQILHGS